MVIELPSYVAYVSILNSPRGGALGLANRRLAGIDRCLTANPSPAL